jgi:cell division protease FtsH
MAGGYTIQLPTEDKTILTKSYLLTQITGLLGGRASEEIALNEVSSGAGHDLKVATEIARSMVTRYGMSEKLGALTFGHPQEHIFLGRDLIEEKNYSDQTAFMIDQEIRRIVDECYNRAKTEIINNKENLKRLAETLLEKEVMEAAEVKKLLGFTQDEVSATA